MLWSNETEIQFFVEALRNFASPEQLFYNFYCNYPDFMLNRKKTI